MKKVLALLIVMVLCMQNVLVFAEETNIYEQGTNSYEQEMNNKLVNEKHEKVLAIIDQISDLNSKKIATESIGSRIKRDSQFATFSFTNADNEISSLEQQLKDLDVNIKYIESDVSKSSSIDMSIRSTSTLPLPSTNYERHYDEVIERFYKRGLPYTVQHIYSVPTSSNSYQVTQGAGDSLYDSSTSGINKLISIYVQKTIGQIPVIAWTPYELLFESNPTIETITMNWIVSNTVCYSYVKPTGSSNAYFERGLVSDSVVYNVDYQITGVKTSGQIFNKSVDNSDQVEKGQYFGNTSRAVTSMVDEHSRALSLVYSIKIEAADGSSSKSLPVRTPM